MGDIGAVAGAAQAIVDAGVKGAERHDRAEVELDDAVARLSAPLPDPSPLPADKSLCSLCQAGDHQKHFSTGCITPVQAIQNDCRCEVVTEQQKLLADYEARLAALRGIIDAKNKDEALTAWAKYRTSIAGASA